MLELIPLMIAALFGSLQLVKLRFALDDFLTRKKQKSPRVKDFEYVSPFYQSVIMPIEYVWGSLRIIVNLVPSIVLGGAIILISEYLLNLQLFSSFLLAVLLVITPVSLYVLMIFLREPLRVHPLLDNTHAQGHRRLRRKGFKILFYSLLALMLVIVFISIMLSKQTGPNPIESGLMPGLSGSLLAIVAAFSLVSFISRPRYGLETSARGGLPGGDSEASAWPFIDWEGFIDWLKSARSWAGTLAKAVSASFFILLVLVCFPFGMNAASSVPSDSSLFGEFGHYKTIAIAGCLSVAGLSILTTLASSMGKPISIAITDSWILIFIKALIFAVVAGGSYFLIHNLNPSEMFYWGVAWVCFAFVIWILGSVVDLPAFSDKVADWLVVSASISVVPLVAGLILEKTGLTQVSLYMAGISLGMFVSSLVSRPLREK